jgi:hypothetical protein
MIYFYHNSWGNGGQIVYSYALHYPKMVHSLVFLDSAPKNIDWKAQKVIKNWNNDQYNRFVDKEVANIYSHFSYINGFAVPLGLMENYILIKNSHYNESDEERRWDYLTDRIWITSRHIFMNNYYKPDVYDNKTTTVPCHIIMTMKTDDQIIKTVCEMRNYMKDSAECAYEIDLNRYKIEAKKNLVNLNGGSIHYCTKDDCGEDYFVIEDPDFTADLLASIYANTTILT